MKTFSLCIILAVALLIAFRGIYYFCDESCAEKAVAALQKIIPKHRYRITCFVQEVLEDGTISYTRVYETSYFPSHHERKVDRIVIRLDNGEELIYHGPYTIEKIN